MNWDTLRDQTAYFIPTLKSPIDTSNFEEYEPLEDDVVAAHNNSPKEGGHTPVGARKVKLPTEKDLPFIGYTYKAFDIPKRASGNPTTNVGGAVRRPTIDQVFGMHFSSCSFQLTNANTRFTTKWIPCKPVERYVVHH